MKWVVKGSSGEGWGKGWDASAPRKRLGGSIFLPLFYSSCHGSWKKEKKGESEDFGVKVQKSFHCMTPDKFVCMRFWIKKVNQLVENK